MLYKHLIMSPSLTPFLPCMKSHCFFNLIRINIVAPMQDLPDTIHIGGRISPSTVWDYVGKLKTSLSKVGFTELFPQVLKRLVT